MAVQQLYLAQGGMCWRGVLGGVLGGPMSETFYVAELQGFVS